MTAHQNPAEPGPGEPLNGPESTSTPVGGMPGGPNPLNGPQTGTQGFHREQETPGGGEEQGAPVDWQATVRARERELKQVGKARHQAEAAIARVRKVLAERRAEVAEREADGMLPFGTPGASWCDAITVTCARIDDALRVHPEPGFIRADAAHDGGPSIAECTEADRRWPLEKAGE